ncbi:uncharacterized protein [Aegilops tauschii subsp. strangulata]|uniref:uncharacterized protein n=1 Tax=Aegilops tauschii subsp. strangulata TaxID=200361 RepID=UPI003CC8B677
MVQALYGIWCARNDARDGKRIQDARELAEKVHCYIQEWHLVHYKEPPIKEPRKPERWLPPEPGWTKANADGAAARTEDKGGGGVVLRDHQGAFRGGAVVCFPGASNHQLTEILAVKSAMQMVINMDVQRLHVELDSQEVVTMLQDEGRNLSTFGPVVEEIKELLRTRQEFKITWTCSILGGRMSQWLGRGRQLPGSSASSWWFDEQRWVPQPPRLQAVHSTRSMPALW